ncbi:hypothetical protein EB837_03020 [Kluyvera ascorbata]|uniref:Ead/Ea22-like family protein n=1 Tax=Kluyvera ascorbata TaxID=51288 RepID=A0A3N2SDK4_9ENTR|nr:hypothetical protein [Kluyvera ascorbata]ROU17807.1 hypothetical protein EB837_03020 [Kluyvera ascorbata]
MSNDITALMASVKAAAEKATPGRIGDRIDGSGSIKYECLGYDGSLVLRTDHKNMEYGFVGDNGTADEQFFRVCVPDNILALVEALEKAQRNETLTEAERQPYLGLIRDRDAQITELESRTVTVKLPERYDVETYPLQSPKGEWYSRDDVLTMLAAAGIQVIEGEGQ